VTVGSVAVYQSAAAAAVANGDDDNVVSLITCDIRFDR